MIYEGKSSIWNETESAPAVCSDCGEERANRARKRYERFLGWRVSKETTPTAPDGQHCRAQQQCHSNNSLNCHRDSVPASANAAPQRKTDDKSSVAAVGTQSSADLYLRNLARLKDPKNRLLLKRVAPSSYDESPTVIAGNVMEVKVQRATRRSRIKSNRKISKVSSRTNQYDEEKGDVLSSSSDILLTSYPAEEDEADDDLAIDNSSQDLLSSDEEEERNIESRRTGISPNSLESNARIGAFRSSVVGGGSSETFSYRTLPLPSWLTQYYRGQYGPSRELQPVQEDVASSTTRRNSSISSSPQNEVRGSNEEEKRWWICSSGKTMTAAACRRTRRALIILSIFLCLSAVTIGVVTKVGTTNRQRQADGEDDNTSISSNVSDGHDKSDTPTQAPVVSGWYQIGPEVVAPPNVFPSFGFEVVLSDNGERLAVSAPMDNSLYDGSGFVQVYEQRVDSSSGREMWEKLGQPIRGEAINDKAGWGMDLSSNGQTLAVGYPGNGNGFVRVYQYRTDDTKVVESTIPSTSNTSIEGSHDNTTATGSWIQVGQTLIGPDDNGQYGHTVSLSSNGTVLAVGAPYSRGQNGLQSGRVQLYKYDNLTKRWHPYGQTLIGNAPFDWFGKSLDVSEDGTLIAIGAPGNDERGQDAGSIKVYSYSKDNNDDRGIDSDGTGVWKPKLAEAFGTGEGDQFGSAVSLVQRWDKLRSLEGVEQPILLDGFAGSARFANSRYNVDVGHVKIFIDAPESTSWTQVGFDIDGVEDNEQLGNALSFAQDGSAFIAASRANRKANIDGTGVGGTVGSVFVYVADGFDWAKAGEDLGGHETGQTEWFSNGPSVSISGTGHRVAVGYESIINDAGKEVSAVRVFEVRVVN